MSTPDVAKIPVKSTENTFDKTNKVATKNIITCDKIITILGIFLIIFGLSIIFNKLNLFHKLGDSLYDKKSYSKQHFMFGVFYSLASLSCSISLFITIIFQALISATQTISIITIFTFYLLGIFLMIILLVLLVNTLGNILYEYITKFTPYYNKISGLLILLTGIYITYSQSLFLL